MKKLAALSLILLLLSGSVFALAPLRASTSEAAQESAATVSTSSTTLSTGEPSGTTNDYEELLKAFENRGYFVSKGTLSELENGVVSLYEDYLEKAALADAYKSETTKTRFFADFGVAFGFSEKTILYGATADFGLKLGRGLMIKTGATYMIGDFSDFKNVEWSLDKLTVSATVGWEW